jgi:peptide/nickel transport system substrate-binding protein
MYRRVSMLSVAVVFITAQLAGCGSSNSTKGKSQSTPTAARVGGTVTIVNVGGSLWTCVFNPYSSTGGGVADGILYEPLYYVDNINGTSRPWLASSYAWSNGNKTLTFTVRRGAKWTDGKPLTAADVAFTFNLLKRYPALDLQAVWTVLSSVRASGDKAIFTFTKPSVPFFYYLADQTYILPQHIWKSISNPVTYTDKSPVGSGPFEVHSCSPQNITYTRNPHYWQKGRPYITKVVYPAFMDNQPGNLFLSQGNANWGAQYIPNIQSYYVSASPSTRHYWFPPASDPIGLFPNLKQWPTNILAVRKAISYAIDRSKVSQQGVYGYLKPGDQTGVILPNQKSWWDQSLAQSNGFTKNHGYDPQKAMQLLKSAGFTKGSDGIFQKGGRKLSLSLINIGGYTDWVAEARVVASDLRAVGIAVTPENLSGNDWTSRGTGGRFQLAYGAGNLSGGPAPYYLYYQLLYSHSIPNSNWEHFSSPQVDSWLQQYATTTDTARQHQLITNIEKVMATQVPFIPILEDVNWDEYDTSKITGWPTASNPYASPAPYNTPDWEVVLSSVHE